MTQFVLDDQLDPHWVRIPIARWAKVSFLRELRPAQTIKDERVPTLLRRVSRPTFLTIDDDFWSKSYRDSHYGVIIFGLRDYEQSDLPVLLRRLLRLPEFRTRAMRMGKIARVNREEIRWWQVGDDTEHIVHWPIPPPRRRRH
jgi:hypothetical protein